MKPTTHLFQYLAELFLEREMFQTNVADKIKTLILGSIVSSWKLCPLWDNVEEYGRAGETTGDNKIRRMGIASWITKATNTHSEYKMLIAFPREQYFRERSSLLRYT